MLRNSFICMSTQYFNVKNVRSQTSCLSQDLFVNLQFIGICSVLKAYPLLPSVMSVRLFDSPSVCPYVCLTGVSQLSKLISNSD